MKSIIEEIKKVEKGCGKMSKLGKDFSLQDINGKCGLCPICKARFQALQQAQEFFKDAVEKWWKKIKKSNIRCDKKDDMNGMIVMEDEFKELLKLLGEEK